MGGEYLATLAADQYLADDLVGDSVYTGPTNDSDNIGNINNLVINEDGTIAGLIVGVGRGSVHPPRLVRVEWVPEAADARSVALIGKGITFDSGGLSLKPPASMPEMKSDMAGAATVLATVLAGWALHTLVERPAMRRFGAREAPRLFRRSSPPQKGTA